MNAGQTGKYHDTNGNPTDAKVVTVHPGNLVDVAVGTKVIKNCRISDGCGGFWPAGGLVAGFIPPVAEFVEEAIQAGVKTKVIPLKWQVRAALALSAGGLAWRAVDYFTR